MQVKAYARVKLHSQVVCELRLDIKDFVSKKITWFIQEIYLRYTWDIPEIYLRYT